MQSKLVLYFVEQLARDFDEGNGIFLRKLHIEESESMSGSPDPQD